MKSVKKKKKYKPVIFMISEKQHHKIKKMIDIFSNEKKSASAVLRGLIDNV